jgi:hypothetical protein
LGLFKLPVVETSSVLAAPGHLDGIPEEDDEAHRDALRALDDDDERDKK